MYGPYITLGTYITLFHRVAFKRVFDDVTAFHGIYLNELVLIFCQKYDIPIQNIFGRHIQCGSQGG